MLASEGKGARMHISLLESIRLSYLKAHYDLLQEMADGDHVKDQLRNQLLDLQDQNDKMEGLIHFLEEDKKRLQDKIEAMMQDGEI